MNFVGEKCAACGQVFTDDDDVVVCPDCGSPHHRDCFINAGRCANEAYHIEKKKWKKTVVQDDTKDFIICPFCRFPNSNSAERCEHCGTDLTKRLDEDVISDSFSSMFDEELGQPRPYLGFDPNEDLGGATVKEVSDFVKTNTIYYLPVFKRMKDVGSKLSFNLTCLFFPSLYFANRKMWGWAFLAVIISAILNFPSVLLYMAETESIPEYLITAVQANEAIISQLDVIGTVIDLGVKILFCLLGNSIYFKYIIRSLKKIKESGSAYMAQRLAAMGGVNPINMILITVIRGVILLAVFMLGIYVFDVFNILNDLSSAALTVASLL